MSTADRLLLDTQIHRNLAYGRFPAHQVAALERLAAVRPRVLWTCDIVIRELIAHIRPQEAGVFPHFREAFRWMDHLCGNSGIAAPLHHAVWTAVFGETLALPKSHLVGLNQWRRRLLKANSIDDVAMMKPTESIYSWSRQEKDVWSGLGRQLRWGLRKKPRHTAKERRDAIVQALVQIITDNVLEEGRRRGLFPPGGTPSPERIMVELREFIHLHVKVFSAKSVASYNYRKHATDAMDRWLLVYPGAGYTLVTEDQRLVRTLSETGCPEPRVCGLEERWRSHDETMPTR